MTDRAMTVWLAAEKMAELLELPEGAYVDSVTQVSGIVGYFEITIRGYGAPVVPGRTLASGHVQITKWQLDANTTRRETVWRLS